METMKIIDAYDYGGTGYAPFLIGDKWQVAFLNYAPEEALESIVKLDVHHYTDEVFVLLDGRAALIGAQVDDGGVAYEAVDMRPLCAYNIRRGVWHKIAMQPGSRVLIVENCNTHLGDFEFYDLSAEQIAALRETVVKVWSEENGNEDGIVIWIGFFNTILEGCFSSEFQKNGIIECYFNQDGFYDEKWEMKYPHIVLEELKRFNEKLLDTRNEEIIKKSKEVVEQLVSFINMAVRNEKNIYVEYD